MKKILLSCLIICAIVSCNKDGKVTPIFKQSTGSINHIIIVMSDALWKDTPGTALKDIITEPILGMPQDENQFSIARVSPDKFGDLLKTNKNILYVELGDTNAYNLQENKFAKPQNFISIQGKDKETLSKLLKENASAIIKEFKNMDLSILQKRMHAKTKNKNPYKIYETLQTEITIPQRFKTVDDQEDFLWLRKHLPKGATMEFMMYNYPFEGEVIDVNSIVAMRDSIGKKHILGDKEGAYMITEKAYTPHVFDVTIDGKKGYETRGKWEINIEFMAGPFLNYCFLDKENKRLIVMEGFVYAPSQDKRDYVFQLEAMMKTVQFK